MFIHPRDQEITGQVVLDFITAHQAQVPRYKRLEELYQSKAPILRQEAKANFKPDNRLVVNFAKYITDTFNGYFIGVPVKVDHDSDDLDNRVDNFMRANDMDDNLAELSKMTSIYGHAYLFAYQDEQAQTCCTYNSPLDMFVVYDDTIAQKPLFAVRYQYDADNKLTGQLYTTAQRFDFYQHKDSVALTDGQPHYYGDVPIIEFKENEERQSLFESVETLINAYDKALSEKTNDVDYFADAYMSILGAELDEEGIAHIRDNRIINLFGTSDASKIVVEFLNKPDGDNTQEHLLDRMERLIYTISMVANINDESFGNASGVSLEFKLQPMKNLAAMKERKFASGLNQLFKLWFALPTNVPANQRDEWAQLNYQFTRNIPRNLQDEASVASALEGIVSKETQLKTLSIVDNVKAEMQKMDDESMPTSLSDAELSTRLGRD